MTIRKDQDHRQINKIIPENSVGSHGAVWGLQMCSGFPGIQGNPENTTQAKGKVKLRGSANGMTASELRIKDSCQPEGSGCLAGRRHGWSRVLIHDHMRPFQGWLSHPQSMNKNHFSPPFFH